MVDGLGTRFPADADADDLLKCHSNYTDSKFTVHIYCMIMMLIRNERTHRWWCTTGHGEDRSDSQSLTVCYNFRNDSKKLGKMSISSTSITQAMAIPSHTFDDTLHMLRAPLLMEQDVVTATTTTQMNEINNLDTRKHQSRTLQESDQNGFFPFFAFFIMCWVTILLVKKCCCR